MDKFYGIHDQWTDLDITNDVAIKSTDGVIESIKVNGEEYGGGGGSSDFSTATMTVVNERRISVDLVFATFINGNRKYSFGGYLNSTESGEYKVVLYKGSATLNLPKPDGVTINVSGDIVSIGNSNYGITGDCTITINTVQPE